MCPNWDSRAGQLTRQYKTGITTVKPALQKNCNCYFSNSQPAYKEILPGTEKANKICIHKSGQNSKSYKTASNFQKSIYV